MYYKYYMHAKSAPPQPLDDGWIEPEPVPASSQTTVRRSGDTVLYRADGQLVPAVLVEARGNGSWAARDARHAGDLIYLPKEVIATRLPRTDLDDEAA